MIDIHSHILPELDDGAQSLQDSLEMARVAIDSGVRAMIATPHCAGNRTREVYGAWKLLREALQENQIPLKVFLGMEIFGTSDTARMLQNGELFTLNGSRYPLIEFDFAMTGAEENRILRSVVRAGFRPVIAHPERYAYVQQHPKLLNDWLRMGCLIQVNRGSLLGRFGHRAQELAFEMTDRGFAAVIASDAHSSRVRTPWMEDVWELLSQEISPRCAQVLLKENPKKILKNEDIPPVEPEWF